MKMVFKELYLFSPQDKKAKKIEFSKGINIITSNQENGTDRGKSVIMRSIYYALGADCWFDDRWEPNNKIYILKFSVDDKIFYIYRNGSLHKIFDANKNLLYITNNRKELAQFLQNITGFAVLISDRNKNLEIAPPVYNYLLFFIDQDHYECTKFDSFKNLQQYSDYKNSVLFYHFGVYNNEYFELLRKKGEIDSNIEERKKRLDLINGMLADIERNIPEGVISSDIDSLNKEIELYKNEYNEILDLLNQCKNRLIDLKNEEYKCEHIIFNIDDSLKVNEEKIKKLNHYVCPECNSVLNDTVEVRCKHYNLTEDIILLKSSFQNELITIKKKVEREEMAYKELLNELEIYDNKLTINNTILKDVFRYRALSELRDDLVDEKSNVVTTVEQMTENLKLCNSKIRQYNEKRKNINERYYEILSSHKRKFELYEIDDKKLKDINKNFVASGSNKNIATIIWYMTLLELRNEFNKDAIMFPVLFDSPNNVETDDQKKHDLLQFIIDSVTYTQLIFSSIGFNPVEFENLQNYNLIKLENNKRSLLDTETFTQYYDFMKGLCLADM